MVQGPRVENMPYALEILGDDYHGYGGVETRNADCAFIVRACNAHDELVAELRSVIHVLHESAKQHRSRGDDAHGRICDLHADDNGAALAKVAP
jgi:hypothetical protein